MRTRTPFLGRATEMEILGRLVAEYRVVTLVGPGGIGKTTLAREFAHQMQATVDGNVLVATLVGAAAQDDVAELVARTAGLASVDALYFGSVDRSRFLVLDNCESALAGARRLVSSLLDSDRTTRVLATSRAPLGLPEERVVRIGSLGLPPEEDVAQARTAPSVQLFLDRAQRLGALATVDDDTIRDIVRVVRQLDGMPLAIELAAARTKTLSPAQISALLTDELGLLHRAGDEDDRHHNMRAVIDGSYEPLAAHVRAGFRAICVFDAPFDLELAHQVMSTKTELEAVEILTELIDASLVVAITDQPAGHRYRVLEPIRRFGLERVEAEGELAALIDRFVDVMARYADSYVAAVLADFSPELFSTVTERVGHLVHAIDRCITSDATAARSNRLFLPLFGSSKNRSEQSALAKRITTTWFEPAPLHLEARAAMANVVTFGGDSPFARELIAEVMADESAGDLPRMLAHRCLGFLDAYAGDLGAARLHFGEALALAERVSPAFAREIECSVAATSATPDEVADALPLLRRVATEAADSGSIVIAQWAHIVATELSVAQGDVDAAVEHAQFALDLAGRAGFAWSLGAAQKAMGIALGARDGWSAAAPFHRLAFDANLANGDLAGAATLVRTAAAQALHCGDESLADALWTSFPTGLGRSIISPAFGDEDRQLEARGFTPPQPDLASSIRAVRALLGDADDGGAQPAVETVASSTGTAAPPAGTVIRFDDCELDLDRFELRRQGARVPMEPQVFDVLAYLVRHRDRLVPKEEMLDEIWGDRFVSESALTSRIKAARQATGDDGETQRTIRTVRGRGYMFVAAVEGDDG